uniref:CDP-diacylglycerol--inositol 3-phosphatidyltransferase n=1 Tax=Oryza punctata TaxID=4537 RepID=A0A0E0JUW8_ORYPU
MAQPSSKKTPSVYLYIPNIIGYFRIIINFIAFAVCYSNRVLFAILYFFSFFCDGLDGWFARKFNQASTFGAVLDMTWLSFLDVAWVGYYKPLVSNVQTSHKDVKDTGNWLLKLYYGHRPFMAFCCVASEVLYIILFLFADEKSTSLLNVCRDLLKQSPLTVFVFISTLVGWALKQVINVIQMKSAADACVVFDLKRGK